MTRPAAVRHFHEDLARLKSRLLEMAALAEELVERAIASVLSGDEALARAVVEDDERLDAFELEIDDASLHLLALQQPMARDLRLITMIMRISNDLERVGDHAVNIAQAVIHMADAPRVSPIPEIEEMAGTAREMLGDVMTHFVRSDADGALEVCARDDLVDRLHNSVFRILLTHMMEDPRKIGGAMSLILVSKNLERIADLATNIGEDVVFLVEGRTIKHGAEERTVGEGASVPPG